MQLNSRVVVWVYRDLIAEILNAPLVARLSDTIQFFLRLSALMGLFANNHSSGERTSPKKVIPAGVTWGAAIGCRGECVKWRLIEEDGRL